MKDSDAEALIERVRRAFATVERPDPFLAGSRDGCEPEEETGPFRGRDWRTLEAAFLDAHYCALSFFSEGALRYFLPAYLIADIRGELQTADPVFALTYGFETDAFVNPIRYGAITMEDYARFRLSVFAREEASVIVDYLKFARDRDDIGLTRDAVDAALERFWLARLDRAPSAADLLQRRSP